MCAPRSFVLVLAVCGSLSAQFSVHLPEGTAATEGNSSSSYPWNRRTSQIRLQDVYDTTNFSNQGVNMPILIRGARWRANATSSSWTGGTYANAIITVAESQFDYNAISIGFDNNYLGGIQPPPAYAGAVNVQAGTGNGTGVPGPSYVDVTFTTPVVYDPAAGFDLIVDVQLDGSWAGGTSWSNDIVSSSFTPTPASNRIYNLTDWQAPSASSLGISQGTVIELDYVPAMGINAAFSADKRTAGPGETIQFTDQTFTSNPPVLSWAWDFNGDSTPDSTVQNPTWAFGSCGPQDVSLTATDSTGSDTRTEMAFISIDPPVASFDQSPNGPAPLVVNFTDTSTNLATMWDWDLDGDLMTDSTMQNPSWAYVTEGLFTVSLTASNPCGSSTVSGLVDTRSGLCTTFAGGNGLGNGLCLFTDVTVLNPAGITVTSLDVHNSSAGASLTIDVYTTPNTWVGNDTNMGAWTLVATGNATSMGEGIPTPVDISDFCLAPGSYGVVYNYTSSAGTNRYTTGTGGTGSYQTFSNADLSITSGRSNINWGTGFNDPRTWNGCIFYQQGAAVGRYDVIGNGCANSTGMVATNDLAGGAVPTVGQVMFFDIANAPPNEMLSFLLFGFFDVGGIDLGVIGMPGCPLHADGVVSLAAPTNALGVGSALLGVPNDPAQVGATFYTQPFVRSVGTNPFGASTGVPRRGVVGSCQ